MKLFIDTTNSKFILALVEDANVLSFTKKETNRNMAKMANKWIEEFLKKNKVQLKDLDGYLVVTGPGSFTGVKVGANIVNTLVTVFSNQTIETIDTFTLLDEAEAKYIALPFGKGKFYLKKKGFLKKGFTTTNQLPEGKEGVIGYENFDKKMLADKLSLFKPSNKVEPIYPKLNYK